MSIIRNLARRAVATAAAAVMATAALAGPWGAPDGAGQKAAQAIYDAALAMGLSEDDAYAIMGNAAIESSNFSVVQEFRPYKYVNGILTPCSDSEVRSGIASGRGAKCRGGAGYMQWTGPRRDAFEDFVRSRGTNIADPATAAEFMMLELRTTHASALAALQNASGLKNKTEAFMKAYLAPGIPHAPNRVAAAERMKNGDFTYGGTQFAGGSSGGTYGPGWGPNGPLIGSTSNGGFMNFRSPFAPVIIPAGTS